MITKYIEKYVERVQLTLGVIFLSIFFLTILIQVFSRYAGIPMIWSEEVANYSFIWSVFMGASVMVNRKGHFRFTMLIDKMSGLPKILLNTFIEVILLVFNALILYYGIIATTKFWNYTWVSLPAMKMGYVLMCIPIMGATMALYSIGHIIENLIEMKGD